MDILLYLYIIVWAFTTNALGVWFRSSMSIRILKVFRMIPNDTVTNDDAFTYLVVNKGLMGELLSCPICLSHWFSALAAILIMVLLPGISWTFVGLCAFTQPFISTMVLNKWL